MKIDQAFKVRKNNENLQTLITECKDGVKVVLRVYKISATVTIK